MATVTEYTRSPIISTRGLTRWDAHQGVGALLVRPGGRLEVSRCWRNGEVFAQLRLWQQADPGTPGGWAAVGPEFALPVGCIGEVVRLLAAVVGADSVDSAEDSHAVHALQ